MDVILGFFPTTKATVINSFLSLKKFDLIVSDAGVPVHFLSHTVRYDLRDISRYYLIFVRNLCHCNKYYYQAQTDGSCALQNMNQSIKL
jgi:hypothetical protein